MSDSIIMKRQNIENTVIINPTLKTEIIVENVNWIVPIHVGNISVRIFGGGGGASYYAGGGGGWMNNGEFDIPNNTNIYIAIGEGGSTGNSGGTTSFGTYLSANGGTAADYNRGIGGSGGSGGGVLILSHGRFANGGDAYQFGGGSAFGRLIENDNCISGIFRGGHGGTYGGGGACMVSTSLPYVLNNRRIYGGDGGLYGGGGGVSYSQFYGTGNGLVLNNLIMYAGNGGLYGGGGGTTEFYVLVNMVTIPLAEGLFGIGGNYGGNGGNKSENAKNGTNTSIWTNVLNDGNNYFRGCGYGGNRAGGGGGGYGGNGGTGFCGGGGGYGGNGGNNNGGGGGLGGDGGSGGGGGYGKGADGGIGGAAGGGGYYSKGGNANSWRCAGGGGGYGSGGEMNVNAGYGGGAASKNSKSGSGICIIQYYG